MRNLCESSHQVESVLLWWPEVFGLMYKLGIPETVKFKPCRTKWAEMNVLYLELVISREYSIKESLVRTNTITSQFNYCVSPFKAHTSERWNSQLLLFLRYFIQVCWWNKKLWRCERFYSRESGLKSYWSKVLRLWSQSKSDGVWIFPDKVSSFKSLDHLRFLVRLNKWASVELSPLLCICST